MPVNEYIKMYLISGVLLLAVLLSPEKAFALPTGSCLANPTVCYDYTDGFDSAEARRYCNSFVIGKISGSYSAASCSSMGRSGVCLISFDAKQMEVSFYSPSWTRESASATCFQMKGRMR
jgi:hypothetical protein